MKAFLIPSILMMNVFDMFLTTGQWSELDFDQVVDSLGTHSQDLIFIIDQDGLWELRTVGDKRSHTTIDSLSISGPLSREAGLSLLPILKDCERIEGKLGLMDKIMAG